MELSTHLSSSGVVTNLVNGLEGGGLGGAEKENMTGLGPLKTAAKDLQKKGQFIKLVIEVGRIAYFLGAVGKSLT